MKLGHIVMAQESLQRLAALRMPPQAAYRLLKYLKLVNIEQEVIEKQRVKLIHEVSGTKDGDNVNLAPGTPEHAQYLTKYGATLEAESDLKPFDMKMEELLVVLDGEKGNVLSAADIGTLELFFET